MNQHPAASAHPAAARLVAGQRIAVICAGWHDDIVGRGREALVAELVRQGVPPERIDCLSVPGAFEIPFHAMRLAKGGAHAAIVGCALVVDGGIYRHEFVAQAVVDGLMRVQLDTGVPVLSMSLTPKDFHEHAVHREFFAEHFVKKGTEAAQACLGTLAAMLTPRAAG